MAKVNTKGWISFDLECNMGPEVSGQRFFTRATKMLCVVTKDFNTGEVKIYEPGQEDEMLEALLTAPRLIAHNGRDFDIPALGNIFPRHNKALRALPLIDTLVQSRQDFTYKQLASFDKKKGFPKTKALHALSAWGYRFGVPKIEDFKEVDWANQPYTEELGGYCKQDVEITDVLIRHLLNKKGYTIGENELALEENEQELG